MTKKLAEKYLNAIKGCNTRLITCETLSHYVAIYPELIAKDLTFFEPLVAMDSNFDLRELVPSIEEYLKKFEKKEEAVKAEPVPVYKIEAKKYKGVADFVYKNMTVGGLVDRSLVLKENDLKVLKVLVQNELDRKN